MRTVLREVLRRMRLAAPSQRPGRMRVQHVTVVPARDCRVIVAQRREPPPYATSASSSAAGRSGSLSASAS